SFSLIVAYQVRHTETAQRGYGQSFLGPPTDDREPTSCAASVFPGRKIRGISMARIGPTHFSMLRHRAGSTPDTQDHGLIGKRFVCESANCWRPCSSFVAAHARSSLPPQDPMTVRSPTLSRWSRPQTQPLGLRQSRIFISQKVFSGLPGRPTESKS